MGSKNNDYYPQNSHQYNNNMINFNPYGIVDNPSFINPPQKVLKERKVEKETISTRFQIKIDTLFIAYCILFFISFDIMLGIANEPGNEHLLLMVLTILTSTILGIALSAYFSRPLRVFISRPENKGLMADMIKCLPYFIVIVVFLVLINSFVPMSRLQLDLDQFFAAAFAITNAFAEEMTFSLFLGMIMFATAKNKLQIYTYSVLNCVLFAAYHMFVYVDWYTLIPMAFGRFFLNLMFIKTGRISCPVFFHLLNNLICVMPIILGGAGV